MDIVPTSGPEPIYNLDLTDKKHGLLVVNSRKELLDIFENSETSFTEKVAQFMGFLEKYCQSDLLNLREIINSADRKGLISELRECGGWKVLKASKRELMASGDPSLEKLRGEVVGMVVTLCMSVIKAIGFDPPGDHLATGTPGWDSDIDTVYLAPDGMPQNIRVLEKVMFDAIFYGALGGPPGTLFDTESYLAHAARTFQTEKQIVTGDGYAEYAFLELNAASFQFIMQYGSPDNPKWQAFKEAQIRSVSPSLGLALSQSFTAVECVQRSILNGIKLQIIKDKGHAIPDEQGDIDDLVAQIKSEHSEAESLAIMNFKTGSLLSIGNQMQKSLDEISSLDGLLSQPYISSKATDLYMRQRELCHLRIATLSILRDRFFDEGYNSQGAFTKICFTSGGQIHQRGIEKFQKTLVKARRTDTPVHHLIAKGEGFVLGKAQKVKSSTLHDMISTLENLAMYKGHFAHAAGERGHGEVYDELTGHSQALISQSKYSERVLSGALLVLEKVEAQISKIEGEFTSDILELKRQVKTIKDQLESVYFKAMELEKVKRKTQLNFTSSKYLLMKELGDLLSEEGLKQLEEKVELLLKKSERGGNYGALRYEESILPEDLYQGLMGSAVALGIIDVNHIDSDGLPMSNKPKVDEILKARAGLYGGKDGAIAYYGQMEELTLEGLGLDSLAKIEIFNEEVENLTMKIYDLSIEMGALQKPSCGVSSSISIMNLWQKVNLVNEPSL